MEHSNDDLKTQLQLEMFQARMYSQIASAMESAVDAAEALTAQIKEQNKLLEQNSQDETPAHFESPLVSQFLKEGKAEDDEL